MPDIDDMFEVLRKLGVLPEAGAKLAAPLVEDALRATARAGTDPEGKAWPPKKDGGAPLVHAAEHIEVTAVGSVVRAKLLGVDVYHHYGAGGPKRRILPDPGAVPAGVSKALDTAADQLFAQVTR